MNWPPEASREVQQGFSMAFLGTDNATVDAVAYPQEWGPETPLFDNIMVLEICTESIKKQ